jgi:hypothetical protein
MIKRALILLSVVLVLVCGYTLYSAVTSVRGTGVLRVTSPDQAATISVTQQYKQAAIIGTGKASVHLKPGDYQVSVSDNDKQAISVISVHEGQITNVSLDPANAPILPSVNAIDFKNTGALVNHGITTDQINDLEQEFFAYKPTSQVVDIDSGTIEPGPHNPNVDTTFSINFKVAVNGTEYAATIRYSDLETVELVLTNPRSGTQVFDSNNTGMATGPARGQDAE